MKVSMLLMYACRSAGSSKFILSAMIVEVVSHCFVQVNRA